MTRLLVVTNFLSPYRVPLLADLAAREHLTLEVVFLAESEAGREWKSERATAPFQSRVLPGIHWSVPAVEFHLHLNWGLFGAIRRFRPDVILTSGYNHLTFLFAFLYAKLLRRPFIFWFESSLLSAERTTGVIAAAKRFLVRRAAAHVAFGSQARECLLSLGAPAERIFTGVNTVDMDLYRKEYLEARSRPEFDAERARYRPIMLLYMGRLIPLKNLGRLLEAFARVGDPDVGMFIVGSGPEQAALEAQCRRERIANVYFEGFHQQRDLARYYAMADVLLLPSLKEVWGLVVNEALASGLYVLCSNRAGAGYDLLRDGWNGRMFDPTSIEQMAGEMRDVRDRIAEIRARRDEISQHACREFGIPRLAAAFDDAVRSVAN